MKPALEQAEPGKYNGTVLPAAQEKDALRREINSRLSLVPPEEFHKAGCDAVAFAQSLPCWNQYRTILLFVSIKNEIDTLPLLETALKKGNAVFAPRIETGRLCFYRIEKPDGPWKKGSFGIKEPLPETPLEKTDFPALVFTPGLAFDRLRNRMGRGGAFYDRFLSGLEAEGLKFETVGLCLKTQILDSVPVDVWDKPVNYLIYDSE